MRPTLGVPKLHRGHAAKHKVPHIGPSSHQTDINTSEDPDELELKLQICDLSNQEKSFDEIIGVVAYKEKLADIRASNKRKKAASSEFRHFQTRVEDHVALCSTAAARREMMEKFLKACSKHRIFLEVFTFILYCRP
jgi:hypothetical protein